MKEILTSPQSGYYMSRDVFGQHGDFITSPEIGQIFGELIAVWLMAEYQKIGRPQPVQLIELGPGRGTLIQDILRVCAQFDMTAAMSIHLVELSPYLSKLQSQKLCYTSSEMDPQNNLPYYRIGETLTGVKVFWYNRIEDVPNEFSIVLAHEFFDALPIHKLQRDGGVWKEILIDNDPVDKEKFRFVLSRHETPMSKLYSSMRPDEKRNHVEMSPESNIIAQHIAERLESFGGFSLIMDYGHDGDKEDTFRSFKNHKLHDPLVDPGTADLTADVDFSNLKRMFEQDNKLITFGPVDQSFFLKQMEAEARLDLLLEACREEEKDVLRSGLDMLMNPDKMGKRFKFLSLFPKVLEGHLTKFPVNGFN